MFPVALSALALILCVSFALLTEPIPLANDSLTYFKLAENVSHGKGYTDDGIRPHFYRPPLFSSLLGGWFFVTGSRTLFAVQLYQSFCIAASVFFAFFLFLEITPGFRTGAAALATAWVAVHPSIWTNSAFSLQEPTILLFTTIASWLTLRWFRLPGTARAALAGGAWGIATLSKTVTLFLPVLLAAMGFLGRKKDLRVPFPEIAISILAFFLVIAPWTARNYRHLHRLVPVNDQGPGMLEWNVLNSDIGTDERTGVSQLFRSALQAGHGGKGTRTGELWIAELDRAGVRGKDRRERLWKYMLANKGYFLLQRVRNALFFAAPSADWWIATGRLKNMLSEPKENLTYWAFTLFLHAPFYIILMGRVYRFLRGALDPSLTFLVLLYVGYWGAYTLFWGEARFAIPVYPILVALAPWERIFPKT
jgi:hypothetical protein